MQKIRKQNKESMKLGAGLLKEKARQNNHWQDSQWKKEKVLK